jgi:hypothetical protein
LLFFIDCILVPRVEVEETEQVASCRGVNDLVYPRQTEGVLGAVLVEVDVFDAHPPLFRVLFVDEDGFGEPLRMEDFSAEASREYIGEFLLDGISSVAGEAAEVLSLRGSFRIDVE